MHSKSRSTWRHGRTGSIDRGLDEGALFIQPIRMNGDAFHHEWAWEGPIGFPDESSMTFKSRRGTGIAVRRTDQRVLV